MITPAFHAFFDDLKQNMNRSWFANNKERFETDVYRPFLELTRQVMDLLHDEARLPDAAIPKDALFRFYRDLRFSPDKSPYKLWMGAVVSKGGRKNDRYPEIYFQFGADTNFIGAGLYRPSREILLRIRRAIARNPSRINRLTRDPRLLQYFPDGLQGARNKRLPIKEWMEIARTEPLILNKQFYTFRTLSRKELYRPDLPLFIARHFQAMKAWNDFLWQINDESSGQKK